MTRLTPKCSQCGCTQFLAGRIGRDWFCYCHLPLSRCGDEIDISALLDFQRAQRWLPGRI